MSAATATNTPAAYSSVEERGIVGSGPLSSHLVAPKPVKPRRRQRSIMSLETFIGKAKESDGAWANNNNPSSSNSNNSGTNENTGSDPSVDELFQIMKQTNFMTNDNCAWDADAFPTSPVDRHSRNPIILNPSFQEMASN